MMNTSMNVKIYAIGGNLNGKYVGTATDAATGLSLIDLIEMTKGYACSVHGDGLDTMSAVSGEVTTNQARIMFTVAQEREKESKA
jgi:hypothetical protein